MATLFWVGGSTAYDGTTNRLATTSGGTATVAVIASGDTVTFDANSPAAAAVTTSAAISCTTMTLTTGFTGSLTMSNSLTVSGVMTLTQGTLNTNGQTCSWGSFVNTGSATRTLTLGASSITVTGSGTAWNTVATGLTISTNTATVTCSGAGVTFVNGAADWKGLSVSLTGSGTAVWSGSSSTIKNLTRTGTAVKGDALDFNASTVTITTTLTLAGNTTQGVNRLLVRSNTVATQRTISMTGAAVVISGDVDFQDINITGSPSWTNGGSAYVGDCVNNGTLITTNRTTPATQTANGTTSFNWSTAARWTSRVPLPQDNVVVNNAFSASQTVTLDMPRLGADIAFGCAGSPTVSNSIPTLSYGSLDMTGIGASSGGGGSFTVCGRSTHTVTCGGAVPVATFIVGQGGAGVYTTSDAYTGTLSKAITLSSGTLKFGATATIGSLTASGSLTRTLDLNGQTINLVSSSANGSAGNQYDASGTGITILNSSTSTLNFNSTPSNAQQGFNPGTSITYGTVAFTGNATGVSFIVRASFTCSTLSIINTNAGTTTLPASGTVNTTSSLTLQGASGQILSLRSSTPTTAYTLNMPGGTTGMFLDLQDCTSTNPAKAIQSTDSARNSNWIIRTKGDGNLALSGAGG